MAAESTGAYLSIGEPPPAVPHPLTRFLVRRGRSGWLARLWAVLTSHVKTRTIVTMKRRALLQSAIASVILLGSCDAFANSEKPPSQSLEPRCDGEDSDCLRDLAADAGYPIRPGDTNSEINNVGFGAMYSVCFTSGDLRDELEHSDHRADVAEGFVTERIESPFRQAAIDGCLLAVKDLGFL
jgi:hypothetical protein